MEERIAPCDEAGDEEIKVIIRLDLKEDIGLILVDYNANGKNGKTYMSNADKSMIKRNDTLDWTYEKWTLESDADTVDLILKFIVVTEYFELDYDFNYPEEYKVPAEPISFTAEFGETVYVTITGDSFNGYRAVIEDGER